MAASGINRLRSVMNDFTLYGEQKKPEENDEEEDVLARLANAKRNNVAATATTEEQDVLARLKRAMSDNVASAAPQPSKTRTTPNQESRIANDEGRDRITASHGERFERQETKAELKKQTSGSAIKLPAGMSELARTKQTPSQAAASAADLENRLGRYSATMDDTQRNMGALLPGLDYAKSAVDSAQTEWNKYERKLTLLDDQLKDKKLSAQEHNRIVQEYNALLPYAQQAAKRLDSEISTYNSLSGQAQQMQAQYNDALLQYQQALPEYNAISSRGKIDAEAMTREADKLTKEAKKLDVLANDRDELRVNRGMTPEEVGAWQQETFNLRTEIQEKTARANELTRQAEAASKRYENYQYNQLLSNAENFNDPNWEKLSKADPEKLKPYAKDAFSGADYYKDEKYAIINGLIGGRDEELANSIVTRGGGLAAAADSQEYLTKINARERAAYNYVYATKGKKAADKFLEELTPTLNYRQREADRVWWTEYAQEQPWGASAFSVLTSPLKTISLFGQVADIVDDGKIDQNAAYNRFSNIPKDIRGAVSEQIEKTWGKEGTFYYQTGMSMADFLFNSLVTGAFVGADSLVDPAAATNWVSRKLAGMSRLSLALMGSGAAADTVIEMRERGVDSTRAMTLGVVAGLAEMFTEEFSLETLLSPDALADGTIRFIMKNFAAEGSEELGSDLINWAADYLYDVLSGQNESEWKSAVRENIKNGMGVREATEAVMLDRIKQAALDTIGGALSGGVMSGGRVTIDAALNTNAAKAARATVADLKESRTPMEEAPAPIESEAPIREEAAPRTALEAALDKLSAGEPLTQNDAKRILQDEASVQALRDAGVMTETIRNDSAGRQTVRQLVEQYAAQTTQETQETQEEQQGDITTPTEETTESEAPGLKLKGRDESLTPPVPQRKLTLGNNTNTEVQNNGRQTEAPTPATETAEPAGRQSTRGDTGRGSGLGRFLVNSFRENYRGARAQQQQRNRANALRAQAEARGDLTYFSGDQITPDGSNEQLGAYAPENMLDDELKQTVQEYADKGVEFIPIFGQIGMKDGTRARAYVSNDGKKMWVQIDHPRLSWQQLAAHEELHRELKVNPALREEIIRDLKSDPEIAKNYDKILRRYVEMYNKMGVTDAAKIEEEMLADYRAGFDMLKDTIGSGVMRAKMQESIRGTEARYETNGGKTAPEGITESFAEAKSSVEPPYRLGTKAADAFVDGLNEQARGVYDMFLDVHEASLANTAVMDVGSGKNIHAKRVPIADRFLTADEWNEQVKSNPEFAQAAQNIFSVIPENIRKNARLNNDGTITETGFEKHFKMARSLMQRLVDALPKGVVSSTVELDGKQVQVARGRVTASVGGEEYRRAMIAEKRKLYSEGKLPTRSLESLSHDNWGAMGFLATNTKTIASGDFTTFCPQMYFNDGCWYCYRRSALTTGINNKLTAETVWYTGEILQLRQEDIDKLNEVGGLRIQSFGDWQSQYSTMLADLLIDAEKVGLQIKVITKEPSMIDTVALLKEQGIGKNLYFNLSADYTIERRGEVNNTNTEDALPMNPERPFLRKENAAGEEEIWWKRALTVQEANEYRKQYPWVNTRIVATNADEFIRGLQDPTVDVVTGYHGTIRQYERVSSETGEVLMDVEPLGDAGMPRFAYNRKTGEWTMEYEGKTKYQKQLAQRIQAEGLEREYYTKSCCIFGRCAKCQGKCGSYARSFEVKNATNRDLDSVKYWQREMESGVDNPLLLSQQEGKASRDVDREYLTAVEAGDMETAQRMVDEAAKAAKYVTAAYHGTGEFFNVFRRGSEGIHLGNEQTAKEVAKRRYRDRSQATFYHWSGIRDRIGDMNEATRKQLVERMFDYYDTPEFSGDLSDANAVRDYVDGVLEEYRKTANKPNYDMPITLPTFDRKIGENVMRLYARLSNPLTVNGDIVEWNPHNIAMMLLRRAQGAEGMELPWSGKYVRISGAEIKPTEENIQRLNDIKEYKIKGDEAWTVLSDIMEEAGYDGIKYLNQYEGDKNSYSYIALNPSDVKSADPVTYDDDGNVIPLSERFNPDEEDIRYSLETMPSESLVLRPPTERGRGRSPKKKVSRVRTHAFELGGLYNEVESRMAETQPSEFTYDPISEKKSMQEALGRLKKDFAGEAEKLASSDQWGGSDLDTAMGILYQYRQIGRETGDYSQFNEWSHVIQQKGTKGGQFVQAFAKYSRTATGVAQKAAEDLRDSAGKLTPAQQKRVEGHVNDVMRAVDDFAEEAARSAVENARGNKIRLGGDSQKTKDALNVIKEIYGIFSQKTRRDHGAPVEDWTKLTGDQLANRIASRFNSGNKQRTTMQTILDDLVTFASEHALPKREGKTPRTAIERITDYLNNREAYGEAWSEAKQTLREMYANDPEKLELLEAFLNSTISYNGDDMDRTMFRAILESADALGLDKNDILKLTAAGVNEGTINRIADEFIRQTGVDDASLRDAVQRHITNLVMADNQEGRLGRMEQSAAKELDIKLQDLLRESRQTKSDAANHIAQYLINDLGISGTDAAIAANHIASDYMRRIEDRAGRELGRMFAEKGEKVKPKQRDKLMDLIHLGGLTNANVEDAVVDALGLNKVSRAQQRQIMAAMAQFADTLDAIENDDLEGLRQLIRLQAAARGTRLSSMTEEILSGETDAEYLRNFATTQLGLIAADFEARSAGEKISTLQVISHLLNARTAMRNVTSNQIFDIVDSTANNVGLLSDLIMSKITGQRTVGFEKSWASKAKRQGAMKGMGRSILEVALDVSPEGRNQSKYGTGGRRTFSMANSGTIGKILSKAEEIMGYELNATDEFHKGSVYAETLESLGRFVDAGYMTEEEAAEFAAQEALYRSFQDDTKVGAMLAGLKDVLNIIGTGKTSGKTIRGLPVHDFGLGDLVVKYTQVPGALIHRAIEYSPVGYLKAIYNIAQLANAKTKGESTIKQQRNAALSLGRATTGSGLIMAFTLLAKLGLLRRGDDEKDKNAATLKASQGLSGTQLNVSALGRVLSGEAPELREGDILYDIGFLEPLDSLMTIAALINNDPEIKGLNLYEMFKSPETAKKLGAKSLQGIWLALEDTSAMQTLSNIYSTIRYHDEENDLPLYMQIPIEIASSAVSGFIPAPIRQLAQATDTTYRDQYRSQDLLKQTGARVANAIPGLRQKLAPKITPLGEDKTYQEPWLNALNALANPGNVSVYQTDKVRDELLRVYEETGDGSMLPARNAPYSISIGGESYTLTPDERTEYQRIRGQAETEFVKDLQTAYWYREADADTQASFLNSARNIANDIAKVQWAAERGIKYHDTEYREYLKMLDNGDSYANVIRTANEKLADMVWAGIPRPVWDNAKADFSDIANSDISSYEKGVQQRALISDLDLDDEQKLTLYGDLANADSRVEQFRTVMDTGLSFNETAKIFDKYSEFKSEDDTKAAQDAKNFALWVDQQKDLTEKQRKVIKEQFKYWTMIPAEAKLYEKYTGMGFEPEVASRIDSALSGLQPLPGNDGVTDMQRAQAALGALGKNASQSDQMKIVENFYGGSTTNKDGSLSQWGQIKKVTDSGVTVEKTLKMIEDGTLSPYCKWMDSDSKKKGIQSGTYVSYEKKYNSTNSERDENNKEIKGKTRKDKMMAYIDGLKDLSIEQKDALFLEHYAESTLKDTPWHKGGGGSGKGNAYAPAKLRLPTAERRAPTQQNKLRLK